MLDGLALGEYVGSDDGVEGVIVGDRDGETVGAVLGASDGGIVSPTFEGTIEGE